MLKKKMIDLGRNDFTNYLAEILNITNGTASNKMNGKSEFKQREIALLTVKLGLSDEELRMIFVTGVE